MLLCSMPDRIFLASLRNNLGCLRSELRVLQSKYFQLCCICIKIGSFIGISNLRIFSLKEIKLNYAILDLQRRCLLQSVSWDPSKGLLYILLLKYYLGRLILIKLMFGHSVSFSLNLLQEDHLFMLKTYRLYSPKYCMILLNFHKVCQLTWEIWLMECFKNHKIKDLIGTKWKIILFF